MFSQEPEKINACRDAGLRMLRNFEGGNDSAISAKDPLSLAPRDYEDFEEGSTRLFLLKTLVHDTRAHVVERMVLDKGGSGQSAELMAGIYVFKDSLHPPLDVTAVALMGERSREVYVALTIKGSSKGAGSFIEKGVYGGKRVLITSRAGDPPILEKVFNIVRSREAPPGHDNYVLYILLRPFQIALVPFYRFHKLLPLLFSLSFQIVHPPPNIHHPFLRTTVSSSVDANEGESTAEVWRDVGEESNKATTPPRQAPRGA